MWVARDKDGTLSLFYYKPSRFLDKFWTTALWNKQPFRTLDQFLFPELTWYHEPIELLKCPDDFPPGQKQLYKWLEEDGDEMERRKIKTFNYGLHN